MRSLGETILPHLRFRPLPSGGGEAASSIEDFYRLFLEDDAPHSFLTFHQRNGDVDVRVGPWRDVADATTNQYGLQRSASVPGTAFKLVAGKKMQRTISFVTKITPNDAATIPIGVTNIQTLSMEGPSLCILDSRIQFDFEGRALSGLSQFLISNDVRGSEVNVRVVLREGDGGLMIDIAQKTQSVHRNAGETILESPDEKLQDNGSDKSSLFSCFSHPLLLPPDSLCSKPSRPKEQTWVNKFNSFVDIHGEKQPRLQDNNHAHVGASLLSAIKAKNSNEKPEKPIWGSDKVLTNRFDDMASSREIVDPEHIDDVLACSSRGAMKLKPFPSFDLSRAPSFAASEGHMAMRRMILEKDGAMTSTGMRRSASTNSLSSAGSHAYRGLAMRIEMDIHSPSGTLPTSSFSRSKGSFSNLDVKVRRSVKKRVSRTWISWAESWCMRLWEEEETQRIKSMAANEVDGVSRKRKTNVRPSVRRIGEKKNPSPSSQKSLNKLPQSLNWNAIELDSEKNAKWMFVRQSSETLEEAEECGVEVACTLNATKVPRKLSPLKETAHNENASMAQKVSKESKEKVKLGKKVPGVESRWSKSPQLKKCAGNKR